MPVREPASGDDQQGEADLPYAGRWVARVRGRVIAQGGTPGQARRAAQGSRHKEKVEIAFMPSAQALTFSPLLPQVLAALPEDVPLYLVGGAVRDALMGRPPHDLDFVLTADALALARRVASALGAAYYPLDPERETARVIVTSGEGTRTLLDFALFRGADLEQDLRARDLTVNAMAVDARRGELHDPLGGAADVREKRLRACQPSAFQDDPVRVLRAVRLATELGFTIQPETRKLLRRDAALLKNVTAERLRDELFRMLGGPQPAVSLRVLDRLGALEHILPELAGMQGVAQPAPHVLDVWEHTLALVDQLDGLLAALAPGFNADETPDMWTGLISLRLGRYRERFAAHFAEPITTDRTPRALLMLAALYHDVAKPQTGALDESGRLRFLGHDAQGADIAAERGRLLRLSGAEIERLDSIVREHMRFHFHVKRLAEEDKPPTRRGIYRFFRAAGPAGIDLILLGLADLRAVYGPTLTQERWAAALDVARLFLENLWEKPAESVDPPRLVDGDDLIRTLKLTPGRRLGELLEAIREAQASGKVSDRAQAIALARTWLRENPEEIRK